MVRILYWDFEEQVVGKHCGRHCGKPSGSGLESHLVTGLRCLGSTGNRVG